MTNRERLVATVMAPERVDCGSQENNLAGGLPEILKRHARGELS